MTRTFTEKDQITFAELSGDYNPLHVDVLAARRMLFGERVVHGIHSVLWALDVCLQNVTDKRTITMLKAFFPKPIRIGSVVSLVYKESPEEQIKIDLLCGGVVATSLSVEFGSANDDSEGGVCEKLPEKILPRNVTSETISGDAGSLGLYLYPQTAVQLFPNVMRCLSVGQIAALLCSTRLVGMHCPGQHSLYSQLELMSDPDKDSNPELHYVVDRFDPRFGLAFLKVNASGLSGNIKAFLRPQPQQQAGYDTLRAQVRSDEFDGQRALIIGGSRGLGEVAAKLLAAGGADVRITYYQGKDDASAIVTDIVGHGGKAAALPYNVLHPDESPLANSLAGWVPTDLYYFATPFIFSGVKARFLAEIFNKFCAYYVTGCVNVVRELYPSGLRRVFYPSSVAIDELPSDMGEYAIAKRAGETACAYLEKTQPGLHVYHTRFPRVATDQTVNIMPGSDTEPAAVLLGELRTFRDK